MNYILAVVVALQDILNQFIVVGHIILKVHTSLLYAWHSVEVDIYYFPYEWRDYLYKWIEGMAMIL